MWKTQPGGTSRDGRGGGSTARANAGTGYPTRSRTSGNPQFSAPTNGANQRAMASLCSPLRGGPDMPTSRRCSPRLSGTQQDEVAEVARVGMLKRASNNASNSSTSRAPTRSSSTTTASSKDVAEEHSSGVGSTSSLSKKRKRMTAKSYRSLFKRSKKASSTGTSCSSCFI